MKNKATILFILMLILAGCTNRAEDHYKALPEPTNSFNRPQYYNETNTSNSSETISTDNNSNITINTSKGLPKEPSKIKLIPPVDNKIYFGAFPDFGGPEDNVTAQRINEFKALIGRDIVWAYFSNNWFNGITYPKEAIHTIHDLGIVPFVRLMPRSDEIQYRPETRFSLKNIIDGKFDADIRRWADDAKEDNIPLLMDFAVEANGDWFSWSGYYNGKGEKNGYGDPNYPDGPELYRDAYRHIIDLFREENVTHTTWFFHSDIYSEPNEEWNQPKYYYPGDDYIDWVGISIYGPQNPNENYLETFSEILAERHQSILDISSNKPFAILEFGVTDNHPLGKKSEWLEDAFETILNKKYIDFKAISYWHETWEEEDNLWATLRVDSSSESLETFKRLSSDERFISEAVLSNSSTSENYTPNIKESASSDSGLLFKSGFETGVRLEEPISDEGGVWWQQITGSDVEGFSWPININGGEGELQLIVDYDKNINNYIVNSIESVLDKKGNPTMALHQVIKNKQRDDSQDPYIIYTDNKEVEDLYIKYSLRFPEDTIELLGDDGWAALTEFKTTEDYRLALYIYQEDGELYWYVHGDNVVLDNHQYEEFWYVENREVPVPLGEWFDMEIFWHRSEEGDGRVLWKVDSETVADYHGQTKIKDPINAIMVFTNYASNPFHQWIDNVEIRDNIPLE